MENYSFKEKVLSEQLRAVFIAGKSTYFVGMIIAAIFAFVQWSVISHTTVTIWLALIYANYIPRFFLASAFLNSPQDLAQNRKWYFIHISAITISGVIWGSAGIYLFPEHSLPHQMFLALTLAGIIAGNIGTHSAIFPGVLLFATTVGLPFCLKMVSFDGDIQFTTGIMGLIFILTMIYTGRLINKISDTSIIANENLKLEIEERKHIEDALRASEEKYRQLVENANDIIFSLSPSGEILYASPNWKEILGYDDTQVIGKKLMSFVHPDDTHVQERIYNVIDKSSEPSRHIEYRLKRLDGSWVWHTVNGSNIYDEDGNVIRFTCISRDITESKKVEKEKQNLLLELDATIDELENAKNIAESATKLKDQYVTLVSHDLRTPLAGILGMAKLLIGDGIKPEKKEEVIKRIVDMSERLLEMINRLLDINRLQSGTVKLNLRPVDSYLLTAQAIGHLSYLAEKKNIKLINNLNEKTFLFADSDLLAQIIQNLLSNAIKFCHEGGTVTIFQPEGDSNVIAVSDTGIGMSESQIENIFKHEITTSTIGTAGETGTGFGLPYSLDIMKAHKGTIRVESEIGKGSTFYAEFPITS